MEQEVRFAGVAEKLGEVLKSYGVKDETITNVLADMKSEVQEVEISGVKGLEGSSNTFYGLDTGDSITTGARNTFVGVHAGYANDTGNNNLFLGHYTGCANTSGYNNISLGTYSGYVNTTGYANSFVGTYTGYSNTTGYCNTFVGYYSGIDNTTGNNNVFLGKYAGKSNTTASYNTFIGYNAGYSNTTGTDNTFLGSYAGYNETGSNKLYIANSSASFPLIYGEFDNEIVAVNGKLGINKQAPTYPLHMGSGAYCSFGGTWTNASSRALKENIQNLSVDEAVEALTQLNPVKYNYKVDKADKHVGFIAEDVPDLVASADRKGLSPMDVTAVLTKVVQELKRENQEQQNLICEQQKIISDLQERMAKLEKN
ncbi:MAG: tail fiber domain-containing protein [Candidatus Aminicenantes bacterium]|nr:tail fiber domain-containing protein [Candidatus Aminicenantes bacterium]